MAADWEEIRRLAADFQRVQFSQAEQRLSERNCIEIVAKLLEEKKLDVVHTLDGKEFITPTHIAREIRDELYVHGGRINVVELQKIINVDLVHVENSAAEVAKSDRGTQLILGQLIDERYLTQLAEEVNDKLQEAGQVNTAELSKTYDLPGDFLTDELCARIGRVIQGQVDQYNRGVIFTQAYISRHKARIRGLFSALTRPTPISTLISAYGFQENLLYSVLEELVNSGRLKGSVVGGRQDKAVYMPDIYSRTQSAWVDSFLKQNGYLEFETLSRLGIPDPLNYIKKRFKSSSLLFLKSACVGSTVVDQLEALVEEAVSSATWADLQPMLPSCLSDEDVALLLGQVMRSLHVQSSARLLGTSVVSEKFVSSCMALFDDIMQEKAKKEVNNPVLLVMEEELKQAAVLCESSSRKEKKDERRKKAAEGSGSVKAGGGGNAREIRIRKNKKKGRREDEHDDDTTAQSRSKQNEVSFLTQDEAVEVLESRLSDCPLEMLELLAEQMLRPLTRSYQEVLRCSLASSSSSCGSAVSWRKSVRELQEELSNLYNNIRLFDKGTRLFSDETQLNISRHVLRSICTDATNLLLNFLVVEHMMSSNDPNAITAEMRLKILGKVPEEIKAPLMKLNSSLNGKSVEEFVSCLEQATESCDLMLRKADKKKEKQALTLHRQALLEQLRETDEPALVLHLVSVLLFQNSTHCMLHAPGRCVPAIIGTLQHKLIQEQHQLLVRYQSLVVKQLVSQAKRPDAAAQEKQQPDNDADAEGQRELHTLTREVKDLVLTPRKTSKSEE